MAINFPNTPTSGQIHTENSKSWIWDTVAWNPAYSTNSSVSSSPSKTIAILKPLDYEPPASNYATLDTRNSQPVLDFNTSTQEVAIWTHQVPEGANLTSGINLYLWWSAETATAGTGGWDVAFERKESNVSSLDSDSFGTPITVTAITVPGTSGILTQSSVSVLNNQLPSGLSAGDIYRTRIRRDVANDTAAGDLELFFVEIQTVL